MAHKDAEPWIQTRSGKAFTPLNVQPDQIDIEDIAWSLGHLCRFNGHTDRFYSVAEHCVRMSHAVMPGAELWALLHDAGEAYISDVASPIKHLVPALVEIEERILEVVAATLIPDAFHNPLLNDLVAKDVHACDKWIVHEEAKIMMCQPPPRAWWAQPDYTPRTNPFPYPGYVGWEAELAARRYLERFKELTRAAST